jgi:glucose/arabinose dehydrogenase
MTHLQKIAAIGAALILLASCGGQQSTEQTATPAADTTPPAASETPAASTPASASFSKEVSYDNIKFQVTSPGSTTANSFTVTPSGLSASNDPITENVQGQVVDVLANDMDGDNSPEVAVIVEETPGGKRKAYVYSSFNRKSFGMVNFIDVTDAAKLAGYQGGDEYDFVENTFIRRFPLYEGDQKSGKIRQFQFKMKKGEAMKQLVFDRQSDF